ncbi:MAG: FAD-binding protein, partial [Woeseiaceae bacterium]|nr:FAD-binding protein [Woeseiaceae bacterium]
MSTTEPLLDQLRDIVGPKGWLADEADLEPHLNDWRGAMRGRTALMVSPSSTEEVAAVVRACAAAGVGIVPQGGNTGLCGGALPGITG